MYHLSDKIVCELSDHFDATRLLDAIKQFAQIRAILNENRLGQAPKIQDELMKLHEVYQRAVSGSDHVINLEELWNVATHVEYFFNDLINVANDIRGTVRDLLSFIPDPLGVNETTVSQDA